MPNIITIDPTTQTIANLAAPTDSDQFLQLTHDYIGSRDLDHGTIAVNWPRAGYRLCIIVYGQGLLGGPQTTTQYFAINRQLYNGRAILYAADPHGETTSISQTLIDILSEHAHLTWISSPEAVENLITLGEIDRPITTINDAIIWQWSNPEKETQEEGGLR
jgi:hypothetical protein